MDETTRTAVSAAEMPAEASRLRYDDGREAVQEELSSTRRTARIVGMLILGGYLTYGVGSAIATGIAAAPDYLSSVSTSTLFTASAVWMLLNSALVIGIGALMLPILRPHQQEHRLGLLRHQGFRGDHPRRGRDQPAVAGNR